MTSDSDETILAAIRNDPALRAKITALLRKEFADLVQKVFAQPRTLQTVKGK